MKQILVITTEPLPVPGGLTTGAGLRAWGLAEGLRSRGFDVTMGTPLEGDQALSQAENSTDDRVSYFRRTEMAALIEQVNPDVVVMQHWGLAYALPELNCPLVIDLAGPHLLERLYWGNPDPNHDREEKLTALRRADLIICGGYFQRHYFYPFLQMAGFDLKADQFPVIPFSVSPDPLSAAPAPDSETTFIYGGAFLAWQNPEPALRQLIDEMDKAGTGRLLFYGGSHPTLDASGGKFLALYQYLKNHPRVEMRGWKPFVDLVNEYAAEGHVALDLMERNPERELAYTTRTMVYLQCGLPVIYNNYSEISGLITENNCGWCLNPDDESSFRELIRSILRDPTLAKSRRESARAAALAQSWDKTIGPLADFCANPTLRKRTITPINPANQPDKSFVEAPDANLPASTQLATSSGKRSFFTDKGKLLGNMVYIPAWIVARYLKHYLKITKHSRAQK